MCAAKKSKFVKKVNKMVLDFREMVPCNQKVVCGMRLRWAFFVHWNLLSVCGLWNISCWIDGLSTHMTLTVQFNGVGNQTFMIINSQLAINNVTK